VLTFNELIIYLIEVALGMLIERQDNSVHPNFMPTTLCLRIWLIAAKMTRYMEIASHRLHSVAQAVHKSRLGKVKYYGLLCYDECVITNHSFYACSSVD